MPKATTAAEFDTRIGIYQQTSGTTPNPDGQFPEVETLFIE